MARLSQSLAVVLLFVALLGSFAEGRRSKKEKQKEELPTEMVLRFEEDRSDEDNQPKMAKKLAPECDTFMCQPIAEKVFGGSALETVKTAHVPRKGFSMHGWCMEKYFPKDYEDQFDEHLQTVICFRADNHNEKKACQESHCSVFLQPDLIKKSKYRPLVTPESVRDDIMIKQQIAHIDTTTPLDPVFFLDDIYSSVQAKIRCGQLIELLDKVDKERTTKVDEEAVEDTEDTEESSVSVVKPKTKKVTKTYYTNELLLRTIYLLNQHLVDDSNGAMTVVANFFKNVVCNLKMKAGKICYLNAERWGAEGTNPTLTHGPSATSDFRLLLTLADFYYSASVTKPGKDGDEDEQLIEEEDRLKLMTQLQESTDIKDMLKKGKKLTEQQENYVHLMATINNAFHAANSTTASHHQLGVFMAQLTKHFDLAHAHATDVEDRRVSCIGLHGILDLPVSIFDQHTAKSQKIANIFMKVAEFAVDKAKSALGSVPTYGPIAQAVGGAVLDTTLMAIEGTIKQTIEAAAYRRAVRAHQIKALQSVVTDKKLNTQGQNCAGELRYIVKTLLAMLYSDEDPLVAATIKECASVNILESTQKPSTSLTPQQGAILPLLQRVVERLDSPDPKNPGFDRAGQLLFVQGAVDAEKLLGWIGNMDTDALKKDWTKAFTVVNDQFKLTDKGKDMVIKVVDKAKKKITGEKEKEIDD